jgi:hypothetical protein
VSAELYMLLQQDVNLAEAANSDDTVLKKSAQIREKSPSKPDVTAGKASEKLAALKISFRDALTSMSQKGAVSRLFLFSLLLAIIPLLSLAVLPYLEQSTSVAKQMEWTTQLLLHMQEAHFNLREAAIGRLVESSVTRPIQKHLHITTTSLDQIKRHNRFFIYGDPDKNARGLNENGYFEVVFFKDACNVVTTDYAMEMVLLESCDTFGI